MPEYRYLVIGGGMTGDAACRGIRDHDRDGTIGLVGREEHPPYVRPPLTKGLWSGKDEGSIWRKTDEIGVQVHVGREIVSLDLDAKSATDDQNETYSYERVLLATGGTPRTLPSAPEGVLHYRTFDHYRLLRERVREGLRVAVVGGGFIGSEIAAALSQNGCKGTIVFPEAGIGARLFPSELSTYVNEYYRGKGVEVLDGEKIAGVERSGDGFRLETENGREVEADEVVAGLGIVPNTDLAEAAGLEVDDGIIVDDRGRAGRRPEAFAAGDVARFPVQALGGLRRVEHEDHANTHGRHVGANMAGADEPYDHLPFFYSDLFDLGYEAVGDVDSRLDTIEEWAEPNRKGIVCYVEDGKPRGFLLWDVWDKVDAARALIVAGDDVDSESLRAVLAE